MTQELYERLKEYESFLYTATKANYVRALTNKQVEDLIDIAKELGINHRNNHCPKCNFEFIKRLGGLYYEWEELQKTSEGVQETNNTRRGRKRNKTV